MPNAEYREREPEEVEENQKPNGKTETVGRSGKKYSGHKRGPKFEDFEAKRQEKKQRSEEEKRARDLERRKARIKRVFLIRAFVRHGGNVVTLREETRANEKEWAKWEQYEDLVDWIENLSGDANEIIEEHILVTRYEAALNHNAQGNAAAKVLLPAINKHRYNLHVQAQETANEGMADVLKSIANKPMTHIEMVNILIPSERKNIIDVTPDRIIPTLDEVAKKLEVENGSEP